MSLQVLLSVQEADLESHPNLLRIASLDHQVARALTITTTVDSEAVESAWTVAINHIKKSNHLRIQKATLDRTKNIIGNVARCMRQAPSLYLEVEYKPQSQLTASELLHSRPLIIAYLTSDQRHLTPYADKSPGSPEELSPKLLSAPSSLITPRYVERAARCGRFWRRYHQIVR
jgi:hypothetical protein